MHEAVWLIWQRQHLGTQDAVKRTVGYGIAQRAHTHTHTYTHNWPRSQGQYWPHSLCPLANQIWAPKILWPSYTHAVRIHSVRIHSVGIHWGTRSFSHPYPASFAESFSRQNPHQECCLILASHEPAVLSLRNLLHLSGLPCNHLWKGEMALSMFVYLTGYLWGKPQPTEDGKGMADHWVYCLQIFILADESFS